MKGKVEVGEIEKHTIEYEYSEWTGIEVITIDDVVKRKGFSITGIHRVLEVGEKEKHQVKIRYGFIDFLKNKAVVTLNGKESEDKQIKGQRSPLSILSQTQTGREPFARLWGKINSQRDAEIAVGMGVMAGVISVFITAVFAILPFWGVRTLSGIDASIFGEIIIMTLLVLGLAAKSRISACLLFLYFLVSKITLAAANPKIASSSSLMAILFLLMFGNGVRGAFTYWRFAEEKPKRFSWRILLGTFVALLAIAIFHGREPTVSGDIVNESWWQSLDQELLTASSQEGGVPSIVQSIGIPDRLVKDGGLFVRAVIQPVPLKVGKETMLTYTLFTRYDTRYDGMTEQADFGTFQKVFSNTKKAESQKVSVMGRRYLAANLIHVSLTPQQAGRQELKLGALGLSVAHFDEKTRQSSEGRELVTLKMPPVNVDVEAS